MGLFGGKKVYVSSVVYNMAGDVENRPDYLKTLVASNVISHSNFSMAETLSSGYLNGPGIKARSFYRWAKIAANYNTVGVPTVNLYSPTYNISTIQSNIPVSSGQTATVTLVKYGTAEASYWAEQYVMLNHQSYFDTGWVADFDGTDITITWAAGAGPGGATTTTFTPTINFGSRYYFVTYTLKTSSNFLGSRMWIYEVGSGNAAMDAMPVHNPVLGDFLPFIPIRIKNQFISDTYKPTIWAQTQRAYRKATSGGKISKLIEQLEDNDDLEDIDHIYMVYGVSLNTVDNKSRRYLFNFFEFLMTAQVSGAAEYSSYQTSYSSYQTSETSFRSSRELFLDTYAEEDYGGGSDPAYTGSVPTAPGKPLNEIEIKSTGSADAKLHMILKWDKIEKFTYTGLAPGHVKGDVWWDDTVFLDGNGSAIAFINAILSQMDEADEVAINWQKTDTSWEKIKITGLVHKNQIYDGKSVTIRAGQALADEDESGFIVPIHYETMRETSLVDTTQMLLSSTYLVFNCYEVVKQKWYQTGIFKIFVFVVMIAITVATGGAGAIGLLGTAGSVGASLGFTGLMATIVGAVANALAAMILMQIIGTVSVAVFGAKIGAIIATVASVMAMSVGAGMMSGQTLAQSWGSLMSAQNIIGMTSSVGNGISGYMQASAMEWQGKTQQLMAEYEKASAAIRQKYLDEFGYGRFAFDPTLLTDPSGMNSVTMEPPAMFLDRTLMTGSDVAEMSLDMLSNFAKYTTDVNTISS